jgi:hypothetical protein
MMVFVQVHGQERVKIGRMLMGCAWMIVICSWLWYGVAYREVGEYLAQATAVCRVVVVVVISPLLTPHHFD